MKRPSIRLLALCLVVFVFLFASLPTGLRAEITITSYLLRDRAVLLDSLVMRKVMIFQFKSTQKLPGIKGSCFAGTISHESGLTARDSTWVVDEPGGNLAFRLPFDIPDGAYRLEIRHVGRGGAVLDSYSGVFDRAQLKPYFNREINYWDYTEPYAHLECAGYGWLAYRFDSRSEFAPAGIEVSARMASDNDRPATAELFLNGSSLGLFQLPAGEGEGNPNVISWTVDAADKLRDVRIRSGRNELKFAVDREGNPGGRGLRVYATKNSADKAVPDGVPILLSILPAGADKPQTFRIPVWGEEGEHVTSNWEVPTPAAYTRIPPEPDGDPIPLTSDDVRRGYIPFSRHWLRYVYPWTVPKDSERLGSLSVRVARNDFEPIAVSIYPIRDLGTVRVAPSDLAGPGGLKIGSDKLRVHVARVLKVVAGRGRYRLVPRLLDRTEVAEVPLERTTRFWITLRVDEDVAPGSYRGEIRIVPAMEAATAIPLTVEVLPITLRPRPDITYSMFMSYEFYEMDSPDWTPGQKQTIYENDLAIFRDYKDHGMTTVDISAPFYIKWNADGEPPLEHLKSAMTAFKQAGLTEPMFWYFAHYLHAAKKQHPGNVYNYDPNIHPKRAEMLVRKAEGFVREKGGPRLVYSPIDEPRIESRQRITLELLKSIKRVKGVRTMSSTDIGGNLLDIENNSQSFQKRLAPGEKARRAEREVWEYNNAAVNALNPGYSRYVYGLYTWRQDLDGMNSWVFQTTQNSRGRPLEDLDSPFEDVMLAYPHPGGPLPTPNWEALREGIDDVRYIYRLEQLIALKGKGDPSAAAADKFLDQLRGRCDVDDRRMVNDFGDWTPEAFDRTRAEIIDWILKLQR